jgi:predicted anti-sigma-YlaC factor YlaD
MEIDMSCRQIHKMLAAYQDGELGEGERSLVATHLQGCISCSKHYAEMEEVWQSLEGIQEIETSPGFYRSICKKINAPREHYFQRLFSWVMQLLPAPAITIPIMLIGLLSGAYLGNAIVKGGLWTENNPVIYSQVPLEMSSLNVFAITPPGTLGDGYLRMASFTEDREK